MPVDRRTPDRREGGAAARDRDDVTRSRLRERLALAPAGIAAVNAALTSPDNLLVESLLDLIAGYGGVDEINRRAAEAGRLETRLERLRDEHSPHLQSLEWLDERRETGAFVSLPTTDAGCSARRRMAPTSTRPAP